MAKFIIWRSDKGTPPSFTTLGVYSGNSEAEALDSQAKEDGYLGFDDLCTKRGLVRDDHKVQKVAGS